MNIIGDKEIIKKDAIANLIMNELENHVKDSEAILFYKYPFYKGDLQEDMIEAQMMLVSPKYGLHVFDYQNNGLLNDDTYNRVDNLYNEIISRLAKHKELRKERRNLLYDVNIVFIGNFDKKHTREGYYFCKVNDLDDYLEDHKLKETIQDKVFSLVCASIEGTTNLLIKKKRAQNTKRVTMAMILDAIQNQIATFDVQQLNVASIDINGPQRIRGLAGSGKTVVLAYKAAIYHARHPDKKILYTYYTKALGGYVRSLIERAYKNSNINEPNWNNVTICHGWGSSSVEGVYYKTCIENDITPLNYGEARRNSTDPFNYACGQLLQQPLKKQYDLVLIDEGQDFPVNFYRLCWMICKEGRICWAYDDFQNIFNVNIQNERETFGKNKEGEYLVDFSKMDPSADTVLKKCYRTPRYTLIYAFSAGLGIYYKHVLQRLESNTQWEDLGFKVERGNCNTGDEMVISRPDENTPSYTNKEFGSGSIMLYKASDFPGECEYIAKNIERFISSEDLLPTDMTVICLDNRNIKSYFNRIEELLTRRDIKVFNILTAPYTNTDYFKPNYVTLSSVNRAKGNECGVVFICGVDAVFNQPDNVVMRDMLFTSMTRTKGWLFISGCGGTMDLLKEEFMSLKKNQLKLIFKQPDASSTKNIENVSRRKLNAQQSIEKQIEALKNLGLDDAAIMTMFENILSHK